MNKRYSALFAAIIMFVTASAEDNLKITSVQYWWNNNHAAAQTSTQLEFDIDCSQLSPGLHNLFYRVADGNGAYSSLSQQLVYKSVPPTPASKVVEVQYWWNDKEKFKVSAPYSEEVLSLSTDSLRMGLHSLNYRVKDDAGHWSALYSHYFYKGEVSDSAAIASYTYWWNNLTDKAVTHKLEKAAPTFVIEEDMTVPQEARTNYAGHYTATLNVVVTDNHGRSAFLSSDVVYPDNDAPVTDINADKYVSTSTVKLTWTENTQDKMGDYNVYYSKDNGPFVLWLADTKLTSSSFKGERGSSYVFTVTGRDAFGNREIFDENKNVSVAFE